MDKGNAIYLCPALPCPQPWEFLGFLLQPLILPPEPNTRPIQNIVGTSSEQTTMLELSRYKEGR